MSGSRKRVHKRKRGPSTVPEADLKRGDSVAVKPGTLDPDLGVDIGGWQGRVVEVEEDMVLIEWDSITLNQMPASVVEQCEEQGLDWRSIRLYTREVKTARSKDLLLAYPRERERWFVFKDEQGRQRALAWLAARDIELIVVEIGPPARESESLQPPARVRLVAEVLAFVRAACQLPGVVRIALIGSLATDKPDPTWWLMWVSR